VCEVAVNVEGHAGFAEFTLQIDGCDGKNSSCVALAPR
jgi:hypothetical protein